ncbi:MAG: hypothetical protein CXT64_03515 [Methanobacteriota archaeon]|nr:MAG: hypothetical protein CXT64_03515 [Euryarchaeota archaeon]
MHGRNSDTARKGYGSLLRAFADVHARAPNTELLIVGRGNLRNRLEKQAKKLGIDGSVRIDSGMSFDELASQFRKATLVVYPSYYEGQGLIPLEAMSSGTPVAPLTEMVDESVGTLFQMGDTDSMASAILTQLASPEALSAKGARGRERVLERFTYAHSAAAFSSIYERISRS